MRLCEKIYMISWEGIFLYFTTTGTVPSFSVSFNQRLVTFAYLRMSDLSSKLVFNSREDIDKTSRVATRQYMRRRVHRQESKNMYLP